MAAAITLLVCTIGWAASPLEEVRAADAACRRFAAHAPTLSLERPFGGAWRRGNALERGEFASLWLEGRTIRVANFEVSGEDNSITVRYCFRRDGTLAFMHTTLGTFYADPGPVRVERRLYFDPRGRQFRTREQVYNANGKPIRREFARFALEFERVFLSSARMHAFLGCALEP